jgi:IS5 family transposase
MRPEDTPPLHIQRKGSATKGISEVQKKRNRRIATPRARVEHFFGALAQMGGKLVRCMGNVRVTFVLHLKAASARFAHYLTPSKIGYSR